MMASRLGVAAGALLLAVAVTSSAVPGAAAAGSSRPRAGAWHFVNNNGSVASARMTVGPGGATARKVSVRPSKASGCRSDTTAVIAGKFRIRAHGRSGASWHVGSPANANAPVEVTVHQHGKKIRGDLYVSFHGRRSAVGELELGASATCDIFFGLKR